MSEIDRFNAAKERHDTSEPHGESVPEPTKFDTDEAFDKLVLDINTLIDFIEAVGPDTTTVFQLYHAHGLPKRDKTVRDDTLTDTYTTTLDAFIDSFREWLEGNGKLAAKADEVMQERMETARQDAAEAAAEARQDHLNGGW